MPSIKVKKQAKRTLKFINHVFGTLKPPYKILFDAEMIATLAMQKVPFRQQIEEQLPPNHGFSCITTSQVVDYLRSFGDKYSDAITLARSLQRPNAKRFSRDTREGDLFQGGKTGSARVATIEDVYRSVFELLGESNEQRFVCAVNDVSLRYHIRRKYLNVMILRADRSVVHFEPPTRQQLKFAEKSQSSNIKNFNALSDWEREMLEKLQEGENPTLNEILKPVDQKSKKDPVGTAQKGEQKDKKRQREETLDTLEEEEMEGQLEQEGSEEEASEQEDEQEQQVIDVKQKVKKQQTLENSAKKRKVLTSSAEKQQQVTKSSVEKQRVPEQQGNKPKLFTKKPEEGSVTKGQQARNAAKKPTISKQMRIRNARQAVKQLN